MIAAVRVAGAAVALIAATIAAAPAASADWPNARLNPQNNALVGFASRAAPQWTFNVNGSVASSPSVRGTMLYIGTEQGTLYALDVRTGKVLWHHHVANDLNAVPIVSGNVVIAGEGNRDAVTYAPRAHIRVGSHENALIALDATTGRRIWRYALRGTGQPTGAIVGDLFVHHDGSGLIVGLHPRNGAVQWKRDVASVASKVGLLPVGSRRVVTMGIFPNAAFAIDGTSGATLWKHDFGSALNGFGDVSPATDGTNVFATYLAPGQGKPVETGVLAIHHIYALRAATGAIAWDVATETGMTPPRNEAATPLVVGALIFDGSAVSPYMHALDTQRGRTVWRLHVHGPVKGAPVARDNVLYFGDQRGYLWAVDIHSGRIIGSRKTAGMYNVGSPVIVGASLIIPSAGGTLSAIPLARIRDAHDR